MTVSDPLLTWTAHPARSRPRDVALVVAIVCTTAGVVLWTFESAWLPPLRMFIMGVGSRLAPAPPR